MKPKPKLKLKPGQSLKTYLREKANKDPLCVMDLKVAMSKGWCDEFGRRL